MIGPPVVQGLPCRAAPFGRVATGAHETAKEELNRRCQAAEGTSRHLHKPAFGALPVASPQMA